MTKDFLFYFGVVLFYSTPFANTVCFKLQRSIKAARRLVLDLVLKRKRQMGGGGASRGDLLGALLSARDEDGNSMPDERLVDECMTFLFAGHDTTSSALSWCMYFIAQDREASHDERNSHV